MIELNKSLRTALGVVAIVAIFFLVMSFWGQYRAATSKPESKPKSESSAAASKGAKKTDGTSAPAKKSAGATKKTPADKAATRTVVIEIEGLNFREEPSPDSKPIRGLASGDRLHYVATEGNWYKVRDDSGVEGYVSSNPQYARLEGAAE